MARSAPLLAPGTYLNRESALIAFQHRVLALARDPSVPLLERLRFLTISSSNLDEFFEVRVARLRQRVAFGLKAPGPDGLTAAESLARTMTEAHTLVAEQHRVLVQELLPALEVAGVRLLSPARWTTQQQDEVRALFRSLVLPLLSPTSVDAAGTFPHVQNKHLAVLVLLRESDPRTGSQGLAVVQVPRSLPRVMALPSDACAFVLLSDVVVACIGEVFPGRHIKACAPFRVTRDSELWLIEEEAEDLLEALQGELHHRNDGDAVRLEVPADSPEAIEPLLLGQFGLVQADLYRVPGPVNLHRLAALCDLAERPDLRHPPHVPRADQGRLDTADVDVFETLRRGDVLLHHPYDSAGIVLDFLRRAVADPQVRAIHQTLYRTGATSPYVDALCQAARAGKEVTAVVELRARFDEEANIDLAQRMHDAGVHVIHGVVGHKVHAKLLLVARQEGAELRRYLHLGTGNYHPQNSRQYTDLGLLTADPALTRDAHHLLQQLTGLGAPRELKRLLQAPLGLQDQMITRIDAQAQRARKGKPAQIRAKMNALTDPKVIAALYRASQAGVDVELVVRGICCLRPGVPGLSERIRVRSLVGRFLEHARVYVFGPDDDRQVWAGSADWMERNFTRRVEVCFPLHDPHLADRAVRECLTLPWQDDTQAWDMQPDGAYLRSRTGKFSVQAFLATAGE
jgi:polyphosphate kinase